MSTKNFFNPTVSLNRAFEAGELVTDLIRKTAQNVSATVETISANTAKETQKSIERATDSAGQTMQAIAQIALGLKFYPFSKISLLPLSKSLLRN